MSRKKNWAVTIKPALAQRLPSRTKPSGPANFFRSRQPGFFPDFHFFGLKFCSRIFVRRLRLPACRLAGWEPPASVPQPPIFLPPAGCRPGSRKSPEKTAAATKKLKTARQYPPPLMKRPGLVKFLLPCRQHFFSGRRCFHLKFCPGTFLRPWRRSAYRSLKLCQPADF